jgi:hypothetical protein
MIKEETLKDFLNTLKISFKNASMYGIEHPAFSESVSKLNEKINGLFAFFIPITLGFTSNSLFIDGRYWEKLQLFQEIASTFHFRKLKSIEIIEGITISELAYFISKLSISSRDVIKRGGPAKILDKEELPHIAFEELDYYELLKGTGEEIKDIWVVLLQEALETQNDQKIRELADSFEKVIKAFETNDIVESGELIETLSEFFSHLETIDEKKCRECAKEFVQTMMRSKKSFSETDSKNLQKITSKFRGKDMAGTFWEEILTDDSFASLNLDIFAKLIEKDKNEGVAHFIASIFRKNESLQSNPKVIDKMEELLSDSSSPMISEIYRNTLAALLSEITFKDELTFHNDTLFLNYRFMLINLIEKEKNKNEIVAVLQKLHKEWEKITEKKDYECLKAIHDTLKEKKEELSSEPLYEEICNMIIGFIEKEILQGGISFYFDYFIKAFDRSTSDVNVYLKKIFSEKNATPYTLSAFFKFFKEYLFYFNINLEQYSSDEKLIKKMIDSLRMIDTTISLITLKDIYHLGERRIKINALQAMQNLTEYDAKFLLPILKEKDLRLRAEAFVILIKDKDNQDHILKTLFFIPSPLGMKNKRLIENIKIVEQKELREAKPYIVSLSKKKYIWNKNLRAYANRLLEKWNAE